MLLSESTLIIFTITSSILLIAAIILGVVVSRKFRDAEEFDKDEERRY